MASANVLQLLRAIQERGAVSRTDLHQSTGLSWGTITNITRELLDRNLIREEGASATKSGRKPMRLALNLVAHCLIGIDISPDRLRCLVMNLAGEPLWFEEEPGANQPQESPQSVLDRAVAMAQRALAAPDIGNRACMGIGVAITGTLDEQRAIVRFAPRLPAWQNVAVRDYLQSHLAPPVHLERHTNCLCMAERWFGQAGHTNHLLNVDLGEEVSLGILLDGELFRGSRQMAGQFGHVTLNPEGPPCACGTLGCVECYCSVRTMIHHAKTANGQTGTGSDINTIEALAALAANNDHAAQAAFAHMGRYLGIGLANLIDLFDPELIVLTGSSMIAHQHFMPAAERELAAHAGTDSTCKVLISKLGDRARVMGACGMILQAAMATDATPGH